MAKMTFDKLCRLFMENPGKGIAFVRQYPVWLTVRGLWGETLLQYLIVENYLEAAHLLLVAGADANCTDEYGKSALIDSVMMGNHEAAALLLGHGADPNYSAGYEDTAMHAAVRKGDNKMLNLLISKGGDLDLRTTDDEDTPREDLQRYRDNVESIDDPRSDSVK